MRVTTSAKTSQTKPSFFSSLLGRNRIRTEKARMEAFLAAFPGEYCGWAPDGTLAYSEGFARLLGLDSVHSLTDIQNSLSAGDAMALEGMFTRLQDKGEIFSMTVRNADHSKDFRLSGTRGEDHSGTEIFHILWLDDITAQIGVFQENQDKRRAAEEELARLKSAFDFLPLPVWTRNAQADIDWCNRAYAMALDTTQSAILAEKKEFPQPLRSNLAARKSSTPPQPIGRALAKEALDTGTPQMSQAHVVLSGSRRLLQIQEMPLLTLGMTIGIAEDLTREEELETEQRRHKTAYKELLEHLGSAIAIFNSEQKIEFFNGAFAQLWQLEERWLNTAPKLGDIMEKLRETRRLPEQADFRKFKQGWINMFTSLISAHEDMMYLPDGRALRVLVVPHPLGGLMMTFEDVTSTLELESSYNTLIAVQKETLDNLAEGVAVFGSDGRLKLWNPPYARLWGLHPEDLDGEPHITRIVDRMKQLFNEAGWDALRDMLIGMGLNRIEQNGRIGRLDGSLIDYATVPLPDGGVLVALSDVTASVRVETALRERNAALEAAERLKLDFLANVSYQLRTPLNAIMGFSEILDKEYFGPINDKQREYTTGLQEAGSRLVSLIDDILDLSTIEAGYMEIEKKPLSITAMLGEMEDLVRDWAGTRRIKVVFDHTPNGLTVIGDERRLKQAVLNLFRNAIAFTPAGGTITLQTTIGDNDKITISVIDTGPGISATDQSRIFEPFERGAVKITDGRPDNRGAGLGLSLVRNIVGLHDGHVTMDSIQGKGTTVHIHLPLET